MPWRSITPAHNQNLSNTRIFHTQRVRRDCVGDQANISVDDLDITNEEIISFCDNAPVSARFNKEFGSVLKFSSTLVVRFGLGEPNFEADNRRCAAQLLDPNIVRVPKVYRQFQHEDLAYILMEYSWHSQKSGTAGRHTL